MRLSLIAALILMPLMALAEGKNLDVKIEGMTCGSCVNSVKTALSKLPGIEKDSVQVVLKENKATLTVQDDKKETVEAIKKAIEGAGYKVTAIHTLEAPVKN